MPDKYNKYKPNPWSKVIDKVSFKKIFVHYLSDGITGLRSRLHIFLVNKIEEDFRKIIIKKNVNLFCSSIFTIFKLKFTNEGTNGYRNIIRMWY